MWQSQHNWLQPNRVCKITLTQNNSQMSFAEVIDGWRFSAEFRSFYTRLLADLPLRAIFWEHPPLTKAATSKPYEFVAVHSGGLTRVRPNPHPFRQQFTTAVEGVVAFNNLGGDARLVVPAPASSNDDYTHLSAFARSNNVDQQDAFFKAVGTSVDQRLGNRPMWLNTSGLGVHWLHVRLDSRPKYYTFTPYKSP